MSPEDIALELLDRSWPPPGDATRAGIPVGLTYAMLIPADTGSLEQAAYERANGQAMMGILKDAGVEPLVLDGHLVVRILDVDGNVTPGGRAAAEAMASLEDYPLLDESLYSDIQQEGAALEWEEIESELEDGTLVDDDGNERTLKKKKLRRGWQTKMRDAYHYEETETREDDRGYAIVDRALLVRIVERLFGGFETEDD